MSKLIKLLSEYGADVPGIMERFLNDEDLYNSCIHAFYEDNTFNDLGISIETANYDDAFNYAHTLKGITGNMGLVPLYNLIVILVESLRSRDYSQINFQYKKIMDEYNKSKDLFYNK